MVFYFLIFFQIALFNLFKKKQIKFAFIYCGILLFFIAAFRSSTVDQDYRGYIEYYENVLNQSFLGVEPTFIFIAYIVDTLLNNILYLFMIYAFLGVFLKFYAISQLTPFWIFSALIYFSHYFLLHEMTQIRLGVASGLLLLSIKPIEERKFGRFMILTLLAVSFHFSAIACFLLYLLKGHKFNTILYLMLIPFAYLIYFSNFDFTSLTDSLTIPIYLMQIKYDSYTYYATVDKTINLFNYVHLSRCLLACLLLWKWKLLAEKNSYSIIILKIYFLAIFIFIAFANTPAISSRISELMMVVEIILIPFLIYIFKQKNLATVMVMGIGFVFLSFALFYTKLLTGYFS